MIQAIVLGIVQGLTEFIPVSSSGHLIVIRELLGWKDFGLSFDVALHMGTLAALLVYFRKDWIAIIRGISPSKNRKPCAQDCEQKLLIPILVACVPAAIAGYLFSDFIEDNLRHWYWVAGALVVVGCVMYIADHLSKKVRSIGNMRWIDYIVIGIAQAMALFPGVSRSGATISAGLFCGLDRESAAKFSFIISAPVIFGAGMMDMVKTLADAANGNPIPVQSMLIGFITAALSGYVAIQFLMNYLRKRSLTVFVIYRICLAVFLAIVFLAR